MIYALEPVKRLNSWGDSLGWDPLRDARGPDPGRGDGPVTGRRRDGRAVSPQGDNTRGPPGGRAGGAALGC